jgi:hypothetical protein
VLQYYRLVLQFSDLVEIGGRIIVVISLPMVITVEVEFRCCGVLIVFVCCVLFLWWFTITA